MGYGYGKPKSCCHRHHFMRYEKGRGGWPRPVKLRAPSLGDFCLYCRRTHEELQLEVS